MLPVAGGVIRRGALVARTAPDLTWLGLVAYADLRSAIVVDAEGKLARFTRQDRALIAAPVVDPAAFAVARSAVSLLNRAAVRESVEIAARVELDPAGAEAWRFPLGPLTEPDDALSDLLRIYLALPAYLRRRMEAVFAMLLDDVHSRPGAQGAEAQHDALYWTVLGRRSVHWLAERRGTTDAAVRMSRKRALAHLRRYLGEAILDGCW